MWKIRYSPDGITSYTVPLDNGTRDFLERWMNLKAQLMQAERPEALAALFKELVEICEDQR